MLGYALYSSYIFPVATQAVMSITWSKRDPGDRFFRVIADVTSDEQMTHGFERVALERLIHARIQKVVRGGSTDILVDERIQIPL